MCHSEPISTFSKGIDFFFQVLDIIYVICLSCLNRAFMSKTLCLPVLGPIFEFSVCDEQKICRVEEQVGGGLARRRWVLGER
jgi:hypothetical protein